jgi:hypothetical protein
VGAQGRGKVPKAILLPIVSLEREEALINDVRKKLTRPGEVSGLPPVFLFVIIGPSFVIRRIWLYGVKERRAPAVEKAVAVMRIAVIGAGAAGLATVKRCTDTAEVVCYEKTDKVGGTWVYVTETGKDAFGLPIHSSMYDSLR